MTDLDFKAMAHDVLRTAGLGHNEDYGYSDADIPPVALVLERDHFAPAIADARRDALSAVVRDLHLLADAWEANLHEGGPDPWHILHGCANDLREHASAIAQKTDAPDSWRGDDEEALRLAEALYDTQIIHRGTAQAALLAFARRAKAEGRRDALEAVYRAECMWCALKVPLHGTEHYHEPDGRRAPCEAKRIRRAIIAATPATGEDGEEVSDG